MTARTRQRPTAEAARGSRTTYRTTSTSVYEGSLNQWVPKLTHDHLTVGWPHNKKDNPFHSTTRHYRPIRCSGGRTTGFVQYDWTNWACNLTSHWGSRIVPTETNLSVYAQQCLESIQPFKPVIDVPVEVIEGIRDIRNILDALSAGLRMTQKALRTSTTVASDGKFHYRFLNGLREMIVTPSNVAGSYIWYHFTVGTTLRLIEDLMNLQESIMSRSLRLKRLSGRKKIRFQKDYPHHYEEWNQNVSNGVYTVSIPHFVRGRRRTWAEGTLYLSDHSRSYIDRLSKSPPFAYKEALGLRYFGLDSLWEVIPFSWLIDYFVDVQSFLTTLYGAGHYGLYSLCVMDRSSRVCYTKTANFTWSGNVQTFHAGSGFCEVKRRAVHGVVMPGLHLEPLLTNHQKTIIASLVGSAGFGRRWGK